MQLTKVSLKLLVAGRVTGGTDWSKRRENQLQEAVRSGDGRKTSFGVPLSIPAERTPSSASQPTCLHGQFSPACAGANSS